MIEAFYRTFDGPMKFEKFGNFIWFTIVVKCMDESKEISRIRHCLKRYKNRFLHFSSTLSHSLIW